MKVKQRRVFYTVLVAGIMIWIGIMITVTPIFAASGGRQGAAELAASQVGLTNGIKYGAGSGEETGVLILLDGVLEMAEELEHLSGLIQAVLRL